MIPGIDEIKSLAIKYSKKQLANMAQMGLLDPQKAVMAGMMRDRISKEDAQPPQSTVAQDVLGIPAAQPQSAQMPQQAQPAPGLEALPAGNVGSYAGGGIVAFADGGGAYEDYGIGEIDPNAPSIFRPNIRAGEAYEPSLWGQIFGYNRLPPTPASKAKVEQDKFPAKQWEQVAKDLETAKAKDGKSAPVATKEPQFPGGVSTRASAAPAFSLPAFDPNAIQIKGADMPEYQQRDRKDIAAARRQAELEEGVDPEMYSKMIKGIEEKKGKLEGKKGEAKGQALMQLGLGLMGARRGQEFQTFGEAGIKALAAYKQDVKDFEAASEKYDERMEALRISDQQAKQTGARADIAQREKDRELAFAAQTEKAKAQNELAKTQAQVSANVYGTQTQAATSMATAQLSAQTQKEIANMQAQVQKWIHTRPPAEILAIEEVAKRTGKPFSQAMNDFYGARYGARNQFTKEEAMKQALTNLKDLGIINPTEAQVQAEIAKLQRIYGGGGGAGGTLQQGANGSFNYVPAGQ